MRRPSAASTTISDRLSYHRRTLPQLIFSIGCHVLRRNLGDAWFYPTTPKVRTHVLSKLCLIAGYRLRSVPTSATRLAVPWDPAATIIDGSVAQHIESLAPSATKLNMACRDISKSHVAGAFETVFGYPLLLDPLTHTGKCIRKAERNASHDGVVLDCPLEERQDDYCYQHLINNINGDYAEEMRIPVIGNAIPVVYLNRRPTAHRFKTLNTVSLLRQADDVLSQIEQHLIVSFCDFIGMDYGELDVLRDVDSGKIYIVDANLTPFGPPNHLSFVNSAKALLRMADALKREFLARSQA